MTTAAINFDLAKEFLYDQSPAKDGYCPLHVERLRKSLLDFSCPQPRGVFFKDWAELDSALADIEGKNAIDLRLVPSYVIQQEAIGKASEQPPHWRSFYEEHFVKKLASSALHGTTDARMSSRAHFYYDAVVVQRFFSWGDIFESDSDLKHPITSSSSFALFLPVYSTTEDNISNSLNGDRWTSNSSSAEPFTWSILSRLSLKGLRPFPQTTNVYKADIPGHTLGCYPWLVVDVGDPSESVQMAVARAQGTTSAAAFALKMQRRLTQYSNSLREQSHVPPLTVMTAVGPNVTIWVAYYAKNFVFEERFQSCHWTKGGMYPNAYIMQAIWKGDMTNLRDIIELEMLLENIYTWAVRVFKPYVATCLHQWTSHHPEEEMTEGSAPTEIGADNLHEPQPRRNSLPSAGSPVTVDTNSPPPASKGKLSELNLEKSLEDIDSMVERRIQKLIHDFGLTPSAASADTVKARVTDSASKASDSIYHGNEKMETDYKPKAERATTVDSAVNDCLAESEQHSAPPTGGSGGARSPGFRFSTIPVINSPGSSTRSETRKPRDRAASTSPSAKNRVILPHRRPRSVSSIGIASRPTPSTNHSLTVDWSPLSVRHLLPHTPTRTPRRPASADGSLRRTAVADMRLHLDPDNPLDSSLRLPTGDFFGLAGAGNPENSQDSAHTVVNKVPILPAALMNWDRNAANQRQGMSPNRCTTAGNAAEDDMDIAGMLDKLHFATGKE